MPQRGTIRGPELRMRDRWRYAYRRRKQRIYEKPHPDDGQLTRVLRWWFMPRDQTTVEIPPLRVLRVLARRPRASTWIDPPPHWMIGALRRDARLLRVLLRKLEPEGPMATIDRLRWKRGPGGTQFLEDRGPITLQTVANDLRVIADGLDDLARIDRGDRDRHD